MSSLKASEAPCKEGRQGSELMKGQSTLLAPLEISVGLIFKQKCIEAFSTVIEFKLPNHM
jgi:hypothetical protein